MDLHNTHPYYDDYNRDKRYSQILFVPGRVLQARELTQMQSIQRDYMERLGSAVLSDGTIVQGMSLIIQGHQCTVTAGRVFLGGLIHLVDETTLEIDAIGTEYIGVKLVTDIVDEVTDESLRDPASSYENYNQPGAHRERVQARIVLNDDDATVLFTLEDGLLTKEAVKEEANIITETLAKRTYDESGNFKVSGLLIRDRKEVVNQRILASITEGTAYIEGYDVTKRSTSTFALRRSETTRQVIGEAKRYVNGTAKYFLTNTPVQIVNHVTAIVEETTTRTKGSVTGGYDQLPHGNIVEIVSISYNGKTYQQGTDYELKDNAGVYWGLVGGEAPPNGQTYNVTFRYNAVFEEGVDYEYGIDADTGKSFINLLSGGIKPMNGNLIYINYRYYLWRRDLVLLDKEGNIEVLEGTPDTEMMVQPPVNQNERKLPIGTVLVYPNSNTIEPVNFKFERLTQQDIYSLQRRIDDMEYNQAISSLDEEAAAGEQATNLKGILTDSFIGLTKCDIGHPLFNCSLDTDNGEVTLPYQESVLTVANMSNESDVSQMGRIISAPWRHELFLKQLYATGTMKVNEYAAFKPMCPVEINPEIDNWIDTETTYQNKTVTQYMKLRRWWYHGGASWVESEKQIYASIGLTASTQTQARNQYGWSNLTGYVTSTTTDLVLDEMVQYMRTREVVVTGYNFNNDDGDVTCYFNDIKVNLTPISPTVAGVTEGTVKVNSDHTFKAKFTVLPKTPCGAVDVRCETANCSGSAIYRAQGRHQVFKETVLTTKTIVQTNDPIAQSFQFDRDTILTKLDLYFATKDTARSCVVQVRNMVNGYPGKECFAEVTLKPTDVNVSADGTAVTTVVFNQPVYCNANVEYCFAVLSDVNTYSMWIAELGEKDVKTGNFVTSQPYQVGVLFTSSNASTWTAHQKCDMKFQLYRADFTGNGVILWKDLTVNNINRILLAAQSVDYQNAGIEWQYMIGDYTDNITDDVVGWLPIQVYESTDLYEKAGKISLRAILNVAKSTSPFIAADAINLVGFIEGLEATYISSNVEFSTNYTKAKVSIELAMPEGCNFNAYYMQEDISSQWQSISAEPTVTKVDQEFNRYEWEFNVTSAKQYRFRLDMSTNSVFARPRARKLMNILRY